MTKIVTFANFKGGTGKTTNTVLFAYALSKKGYKVLVLDSDPQANATNLLLKTFENVHNKQAKFYKTLMMAVREGDLTQIVTPIKENLDLLPSFTDFTQYPDFLEDAFPGAKNRPKRPRYLKQLLEPFVGVYDFILIDTPPTVAVYVESALYASDGVIIALQTQERSLLGAENFIKELQKFIDLQKHFVDIIGVLPVLMKNNGKVDEATLDNAVTSFGEENIFNTKIKHSERLKRWDMTGITDNKADVHDKRVHALYDTVTDEFLNRMEVQVNE